MSRAVSLGPPMRIPPGVHQHGLAPYVVTTEPRRVKRALFALGRADYDSFQISQGLEPIVPDILPAVVAMEWSIDVGARVRQHLDLPHLEGGAWGVTAARRQRARARRPPRRPPDPIGARTRAAPRCGRR